MFIMGDVSKKKLEDRFDKPSSTCRANRNVWNSNCPQVSYRLDKQVFYSYSLGISRSLNQLNVLNGTFNMQTYHVYRDMYKKEQKNHFLLVSTFTKQFITLIFLINKIMKLHLLHLSFFEHYTESKL